MRLKYLYILILLLISSSISAQKEANNWFFGDHAGLTWNSTRSLPGTPVGGTSGGTIILQGLPTVIASSIVTDEGCFTLSNDEGQVLFYSDGSTVWNRNNEIMTNGIGLGGNFSASQSGIIMPYPGSTTKYVAVAGGIMGVSPKYSIIDMTLSGGLGAVVAGQKAIAFTGASGQTGESVTSILHANGRDYWVVAPGVGTPTYLNAWLVSTSANNIQVSDPVVTTSPASITSHGSLGYFKFTADGKHFAWADDENIVTLGDFDSATGQFSNLKFIHYEGNQGTYPDWDEPYGIEFSPSMQYLYVGGRKKIFVYELDVLLNWPTTNATGVPKQVFNFGVEVNALQLSSDGRIYATAYNERFLYVITNPNIPSDLKIYQLPNTFLGTGISKIGLPSFSASWFRYEPEIAAFSCAGNPTNISIEIDDVTNVTATLDWNFGDGNTVIGQPVTNGITEYTQNHTYANGGLYTVTVTPRRADGQALEIVTVAANIVECSVKTNRMIRTDLLNSDTKNLSR